MNKIGIALACQFLMLINPARANSHSLKQDEENSNSVCIIEASFDSAWERTKVSFDIPEVTLRQRNLKFHFVKTYSREVDFSFDVPEFWWGRTNIGPVKLDLPQVKMGRVEVKTKVPDFRVGLTSINMHIPEISMNRVEWKFHILKLKKLDRLNIPCKED